MLFHWLHNGPENWLLPPLFFIGSNVSQRGCITYASSRRRIGTQLWLSNPYSWHFTTKTNVQANKQVSQLINWVFSGKSLGPWWLLSKDPPRILVLAMPCWFYSPLSSLHQRPVAGSRMTLLRVHAYSWGSPGSSETHGNSSWLGWQYLNWWWLQGNSSGRVLLGKTENKSPDPQQSQGEEFSSFP